MAAGTTSGPFAEPAAGHSGSARGDQGRPADPCGVLGAAAGRRALEPQIEPDRPRPPGLSARFGLRTWGHWLGELLPKVVCTEAAYPGRFRYIVPDSITNDLNLRTMRQSLEAYGISGDRLFFVKGGHAYRFSNLFAVSSVVFPRTAIHPAVVALMQNVIPEKYKGDSPRIKTALLRRESDTRNISNVHQVSSYLQDQGWSIVDMGVLDFDEQVTIFATSRSVVSVLGSGLAGLIYAPKNINVITLAPSNWSDLFFFSLMQERRARLADVRGLSATDDPSDARTRPFQLRIADLEEALTALETSVEPQKNGCPVASGANFIADAAAGSDSKSGPSVMISKCLKEMERQQMLDHTGISYLDFFSILNKQLMPRTYFEIGTANGESMLRFKCDTICVDPHFQIDQNVLDGRRRAFFFQMRSSEFFSHYDLRAFLPAGPDIVFQDGLHHFEALLQDFINTERFCHGKSLMILHDCLPLNERMAERAYRVDETENPLTRGHWTGDVWRIIPILQKFRPDLRIFFVDCPPTGLVLCSNLDPYSTVLADHYDQIVREFSGISLSSVSLPALWHMFPMLASDEVTRHPASIPVMLGLV